MNHESPAPQSEPAFGAPGAEPRWTQSTKEGVGTAYHTACRLWFTISHGLINEIYYPHVDQPNTRDLQFLITDGETSRARHDENTAQFCLHYADWLSAHLEKWTVKLRRTRPRPARALCSHYAR